MSVLIDAALEVDSFCKAKGWQFCFIGGMAVMRWGEPRFTQDVDISLLTGFGGESSFIEALMEEYRPRIEGLQAFAVQNRVALLMSSRGIPIDVSLAGLPFEEAMFKRASDFEVEQGKFITTASAEDLVILKAFANRDKDWHDIRGILSRQNKKLDRALIFRELKVLVALKEEPDILNKLTEYFER